MGIINKRKLLSAVLMIALVFGIALTVDYDPVYAAGQTGTAIVTTKDGVNVRAKASTKSSIVTTARKGTEVTVISERFVTANKYGTRYRWEYIKVNGKTGYVRSDLLGKRRYTTRSCTTTSTINYRKGAGKKMCAVGTIKKDSKIKVVLLAKAKHEPRSWYKIKRGTRYYYVSARYVKLDTLPTPIVATTISKSGLSYPTLISTGRKFALFGKLTSNKPIEVAKVGIKTEAGKWVCSKTLYPKTEVFPILDADPYIKFGELESGKYRYVIRLTIDGEKYTVVDRKFKVRPADGSEKIARQAIKVAWPIGTPSSSYAYDSKGSSTPEFKEAINQAYPDRTGWGKAPRVGASCDVFVGTVARSSGYDKEMPRGLDGMWKHLPASSYWTKIRFNGVQSQLEPGDIIIYSKPNSGHVFIYVEIKGKGYIAEAHYQRTYGYIETNSSAMAGRIKLGDKSKISVYRATY